MRKTAGKSTGQSSNFRARFSDDNANFAFDEPSLDYEPYKAVVFAVFARI